MGSNGSPRPAFGRSRGAFGDEEIMRVELHLPGATLRQMYQRSSEHRRSLSSIVVEALDRYLVDPDVRGSG